MIRLCVCLEGKNWPQISARRSHRMTEGENQQRPCVRATRSAYRGRTTGPHGVDITTARASFALRCELVSHLAWFPGSTRVDRLAAMRWAPACCCPVGLRHRASRPERKHGRSVAWAGHHRQPARRTATAPRLPSLGRVRRRRQPDPDPAAPPGGSEAHTTAPVPAPFLTGQPAVGSAATAPYGCWETGAVFVPDCCDTESGSGVGQISSTSPSTMTTAPAHSVRLVGYW